MYTITYRNLCICGNLELKKTNKSFNVNSITFIQIINNFKYSMKQFPT